MSINRSITTKTLSNTDIRILSPKLQRINIIEEKLNQITETKVKCVRDNAYENIQNRVSIMEKRLMEGIRNTDYQIRQFQDTVKDFDRKYIENKSRHQYSTKVRKQMLLQLHSKMEQFILMEQELRKQSQRRLVINFQEKYQIMSLQLAKQVEKRKRYFLDLDEDLSLTLPQINADSKAEVEEMNQKTQELNEVITAELQNFCEQIKNQSRKRQKSYQHLINMMNQVIGQIKNDLNHQKVSREENKNRLIKLFNNACSRLSL